MRKENLLPLFLFILSVSPLWKTCASQTEHLRTSRTLLLLSSLVKYLFQIHRTVCGCLWKSSLLHPFVRAVNSLFRFFFLDGREEGKRTSHKRQKKNFCYSFFVFKKENNFGYLKTGSPLNGGVVPRNGGVVPRNGGVVPRSRNRGKSVIAEGNGACDGCLKGRGV